MVRNYRKRFFRVLVVFAKMLLAFWKEWKLTQRHGYQYAQEKMLKKHFKCAGELYQIGVSFGGIYIKLCQFFSTKRDIFPEPYIKVLSPLQDRVPPVPFSSIKERLIEEYGNYERIFLDFSQEPLAAASFGQVHRAVLRNGKPVIVKVLKKEAEQNVDFDFAILFHVIRFFNHFSFISRHINLSQLLDEFIHVTSDELNFKREIFIAMKMRTALTKFSYLIIPRIYKEFCTRRMIVMEYCDGRKISEITDFQEMHCNPKILADRILEVFFEQFVFIRWVHFDPHPGNILVAPGNKVILLDFGMAGEITSDMSSAIARGIIAVMNQDCHAVLKILQEQGFFRRGSNPYVLLPLMEFLLDKVAVMLSVNKESIQTFDFTPIRNDFYRLIYSESVIIPVKWAYVGKTVAALAGFIAALNPDFKIHEQIKKYAAKIIMGTPQFFAQASAKDVLHSLSIMTAIPERLSFLLDEYDRGTLVIRSEQKDLEDNVFSLNRKISSFSLFIAGIFLFCEFAPTLVLKIPHYIWIIAFFSGGMILAGVLGLFRSKKIERKKRKVSNYQENIP